ncbi:MAG: hemerythrin domain-containing protein [Roseibium sp.]|uniref:hemerythrin domain-containing protein n=1 Tax=Roseibium sp. TaxID=1936156 RepID=UPI0026344DEA|nr:hemerythrin domain-containing protein [Roseibium sp.]MCV0425678.1 hemerythrin domain-containing protein [Roseibium sp.]
MDKHEEQRVLAIGALLDGPPASLFSEPIEYIFADHFRQRSLCSVLEQIADQTVVDHEMASAALTFLEVDFELHVIDEEEDLFPLLRRRARPEDAIENILGTLSQDHALDQFEAETIMDVLTRLTSNAQETCTEKEAGRFKNFASNEKRHLICENAIVLPLARKRLTSVDLKNLGRRMAARRGIIFRGVNNAH